MIATECVTDIAYCPSGTLDASLDISPAVPRMGSTVWRNGYLGVQRCNFAVNGIERAYKNEVISEEQYHQLLLRGENPAGVLLLDADLLLRQRSVLFRRRYGQRGFEPDSGVAAHGRQRGPATRSSKTFSR